MCLLAHAAAGAAALHVAPVAARWRCPAPALAFEGPASWEASHGAHTPFVLVSHLKLKSAEYTPDFLALASRRKSQSELHAAGLLHQTLDKDQSDPQGCSFCWTEVFQSDKAYMDNLDTRRSFLRDQQGLVEWINLEVYGSIGEEVKQCLSNCLSVPGLPVAYFETQLGFSQLAHVPQQFYA